MWSKVGCSDPNHLFEPTAKGSAWIGPSGFEPLTAVWTSNLFMGPRLTDAEQRENLPWQICPGSPLTVATYHWAGVGRTDLTLPNFMLPPDIRME
jgi:hypothetical protein